MKPQSLDHVALWVPDRHELARMLCERLEVHEVDRTERYTLIGPAATAGKLTLFEPGDGPTPEVSRIASIMLYEPTEATEPLVCDNGLTLTFGTHEGVPEGTPRHSVIGITFRSVDPPIAAAQYTQIFGFEAIAVHRDVATVSVGGGMVTLVRERPQPVERSMLNHLGLLVDSAQAHIDCAAAEGIEVLNVVDAPNTLAVFVDGPEHVCLEYLEHKPSFALV